MAPVKKVVPVKKPVKLPIEPIQQLDIKAVFASIADLLEPLNARLEKLEAKVFATAPKSIQHVETFNNETIPELVDNMRMNVDDKIQSMINAIRILPPNLMVDGKHTAGNIGAICGFIVDDDLLNIAYKDIVHDA